MAGGVAFQLLRELKSVVTAEGIWLPCASRLQTISHFHSPRPPWAAPSTSTGPSRRAVTSGTFESPRAEVKQCAAPPGGYVIYDTKGPFFLRPNPQDGRPRFHSANRSSVPRAAAAFERGPQQQVFRLCIHRRPLPLAPIQVQHISTDDALYRCYILAWCDHAAESFRSSTNGSETPFACSLSARSM